MERTLQRTIGRRRRRRRKRRIWRETRDMLEVVCRRLLLLLVTRGG